MMFQRTAAATDTDPADTTSPNRARIRVTTKTGTGRIHLTRKRHTQGRSAADITRNIAGLSLHFITIEEKMLRIFY